MVIKSPALAKMLQADFNEMTSDENAWKVYLNKKGKVRWKKGSKRLRLQPARSFLQRFMSSFYRIMPIEGQL